LGKRAAELEEGGVRGGMLRQRERSGRITSLTLSTTTTPSMATSGIGIAGVIYSGGGRARGASPPRLVSRASPSRTASSTDQALPHHATERNKEGEAKIREGTEMQNGCRRRTRLSNRVGLCRHPYTDFTRQTSHR